MLTEKQIAHYRTFGFVIHRELFSHKEMESIIKDFDEIMSIDRNGTPFKGTDSQTVLWFIEQRSSLIDILRMIVYIFLLNNFLVRNSYGYYLMLIYLLETQNGMEEEEHLRF